MEIAPAGPQSSRVTTICTAPATGDPAADAAPHARPSASRPVVYVLEPDAGEAATIARLVRRLGAIPCELPDAASLMARRPAAGQAACIVAEMELPDGDGLALLDRLSRQGLSMPVIFITGDRDVARAVTALRSGAVDYLVKPWVEQRLAERLRAVLHLPGDAAG